jgi:hypothetical protein
MQFQSHTDQDHFNELQVVSLGYTEELPSSDIANIATRSSDVQAIEIDEFMYLISMFMGPKRRVVAPVFSLSTADGNTAMPQRELPPPSRYTRRGRAAGPRPPAN